VHINVTCPSCQTRYQLQPSLRGQSIRCPNTACRAVFVVQEASEVAPTLPAPARLSAEKAHHAGSVGDVIPILPAAEADDDVPELESANNLVTNAVPLVRGEPIRPEKPEVAAPAWQQAPPPVRRGPQGRAAPPELPSAPKTERRSRPVPTPPAVPAMPPVPPPEPPPEPERLEELDNGPNELPPGAWEPPPVRRGGMPGVETEPAFPDAALFPTITPQHEETAPVVSKRRARWVMFLLLLLLLGGLGTGGYFAWIGYRDREKKLREAAGSEFAEKHFRDAADKYKELLEKFPSSERTAEYQFKHDLAELRTHLDSASDVTGTLEQVEKFVKDNGKNPLLKEDARVLGEPLARLLIRLPDIIKPAPEVNDLLAKTETDLDRLRRDVPALVTAAEREQIGQSFLRIRDLLAKDKQRNELVERLKALPASAEGIQTASRLVRREAEVLPDVEQNPDVLEALNKLYDGHRATVVYNPEAGNAVNPAAPRRPDPGPTVVVDPLIKGVPPETPANDAIELALVRGVLYALSRTSGKVKWLVRVGIDTTALPVRVPASAASRERILVLSADTETLIALDTDGNQLWDYRLGAPCLGRPVVVDQLAYLTTYNGEVHEIELAGGRLVGRFHLGSRLSVGGARQEGTKLVYFPADEACVYVLDVGEHQCKAVLYTGHPAGSLRGEPLVIPPGPIAQGDTIPLTPGLLVLNQTDGLDAMLLRVFELPIKDRNAAALPLDPEPRVRGWTWFPPHSDGEKVAMLSDEGYLGLFGLRQARNHDPALFPLLPGTGTDGLSLDPFLTPEGRSRGRAQVVHVQGDDFWVLAHGKFQRLQVALDGRRGPLPVPGWKAPLTLGSPLHASRVEEDRLSGRPTMFLVTQPLNQQVCLATAVADDEEGGRILWQRQLGLVCQGEPLALPAPDKDGLPLLLVLDQGGGLFFFDPSRNLPVGQAVKNAGPLDDNPTVAPLLMLAPDGKSAYEIACPGKGTELVVRHVRCAVDGRRLEAVERKVPLQSPLAGTPVMVGSRLVLPLASGFLVRLKLPVVDGKEPSEGVNWRAEGMPPETRCFLASLGGDEFLASDGGLGLTHYRWSDKDNSFCEPVPADVEPTHKLSGRLTSDPLVLPRAAGAPLRVLVADTTGTLTLLEKDALEVVCRWSLGGRVTAGPFLRSLDDKEMWIGCVVEGRRLVWLDPNKTEKLWEFPDPAAVKDKPSLLVGQPTLVDGLLVVADQSGRFVGLDPATGKPVGPGLSFGASVAPTASPVPFGPGRAFASLSDGTALLLDVNKLRGQPGGAAALAVGPATALVLGKARR
jgi:outer membrane protein assembly factor BamB